MRKTGLLLLLSIIFICVNISGLYAQKSLKKANEAFLKKDYFTSISLYGEALNKVKDSTIKKEIYYKIAESYKFGNHFSEAQKWYEKAIKSGYSEPTVLYSYADMLFTNCNLEESKKYFEKYLKFKPDDNKAQIKIKSIDFVKNLQSELSIYEIKNELELNSKYSDFSPFYCRNEIIFASSRFQGDNDKRYYTYTGQGFSDFYESKYDEKIAKWQPPVILGGGINSKYNDGTFYYDEKKNIAYFMQCNGYEGKQANCNIFTSSFDENNSKWNDASIFEYFSSQYSIGHPALTSDGNTMYFVSDKPGGLGNKDIWVIKKNSESKWGEPVNLGLNINTEGNEMFPFVIGDTLLYFASDGNVGFGGLDIYYSRFQNNSFSKPINIGSPFNSCSDDFGIIFFGKDSGMFCSNRIGGVGDDDIYSFKLAPVILRASGLITDKDTKNPIESALIVLIGSDGSSDTTLSDSSGNYMFKNIESNVSYTIEINVKKFGYLSDSKTLTISGEKYSKDFRKSTGYDLDFELTKVKVDEISIPEIYYDFDKWSLRDTSKISLNKIVKMLNENPKIYIRINSHTDERGTEEYNNILSENRAQSVVNYLIEKGINASRLSAKGWGKSNPVRINAQTEEDHQLNRRTTFNIVNTNDVNSAYHEVQFKNIQDRIRVKQAIIEAKTSKDKISESETKGTENIIQTQKKNDSVDFRIQLFALSKALLDKSESIKIEENIPEYKIEYTYQSDGYYRYTIGSFTNFDEAKQLLKRVKKLGFSTAFIVAYKGDKKITVEEAKQLLSK